MTAASDIERAHPWLAILGIGEDGVEGLSGAARALISSAEAVYGGARHLEYARQLIRGEAVTWPSPMTEAMPGILARRGRPVAVLASGDPFCYGAGRTMARHVPAAEIVSIPAPSAFSLAASNFCWSLPDTGQVTLCGRPIETLAPHLQPEARLLVLSADAGTPLQVCAYLCARGFGASTVHLMEYLGGPRERIRTASAGGFAFNDIGALNLLGIEVVAASDALVVPRTAGLADDLFEHDGQLTKREIRAVTLSALAPRAGERLWDVGCGAGSVAIEWLLAHPANRAIGFESDPARAARAARNAANLGVPGLEIVQGAAPGAFEGAHPPDAVFIGGGARTEGVLDGAWDALKTGGRMVANGVAIETESRLIEAMQAKGGSLGRLSIERQDAIGSLHGFRPALTVTQWTALKP